MNDLQKEFILNNYENMNTIEMSKIIDLKPYQINYFLRQSNLSKKKSKAKNEWANFTESEIVYLKDNYQTMKYSDIALHLGKTEKQVRSKINNIGLKKNRDFNDHYFDNIDSDIKAYFLGFIFADGWIVCNRENNNYEFGMQLQSCDKYVLEKLNRELGNVHKIKHIEPRVHYIDGYIAHSKDSDSLRVYSKNIVEGLIKNGIETNKTLKSVFPIVDDCLFFDFLRGYIDGDGCFYTNKNSLNMHITSASVDVLNYIKDKLLYFGITTNIYKEKDRKYRLYCTHKNSIDLLINHLYCKDDLFYLKRKYEIIKKYNGSAA